MYGTHDDTVRDVSCNILYIRCFMQFSVFMLFAHCAKNKACLCIFLAINANMIGKTQNAKKAYQMQTILIIFGIAFIHVSQTSYPRISSC